MKFKRYFFTDEFDEVIYFTFPYEITDKEALKQIEDLEGDYKFLNMKIVSPNDLDETEFERLVGI